MSHNGTRSQIDVELLVENLRNLTQQDNPYEALRSFWDSTIVVSCGSGALCRESKCQFLNQCWSPICSPIHWDILFSDTHLPSVCAIPLGDPSRYQYDVMNRFRYQTVVSLNHMVVELMYDGIDCLHTLLLFTAYSSKLHFYFIHAFVRNVLHFLRSLDVSISFVFTSASLDLALSRLIHLLHLVCPYNLQ